MKKLITLFICTILVIAVSSTAQAERPKGFIGPLSPGGPKVWALDPGTGIWTGYETIQLALDNVVDGGTIFLEDKENPTVHTESLSITRAVSFNIEGESETGIIVQADAGGPVNNKNTFTINASGQNIIFQDMTIRNGDYGIRSSAGNISVLHCTFYNNGWDGAGLPDPETDPMEDFVYFWNSSGHVTDGGAMRIENSAGSEIAYCTVYDNDRGIRFQDGDNSNIHNNVSHDNIESGIYLAASSRSGATGCTNTDVSENESYGNMNNGILSLGGHTNTIRNNDVYDNWTSGIAADYPSEITIQTNTINNNNVYGFTGEGTQGENHGGIFMSGSTDVVSRTFTADVLNNIISNNNSGTGTDAEGIRITSSVFSDGIEIAYNTFTNHDIDILVQGQADTVVIHHNKLDGGDVGVRNDDTANLLDATYNWWGDASGPGPVGPGNGDEVSEYVDYSPYYTCIEMTPECVEYDETVYNVDKDTYYYTIQAAVEDADSGNTIEVAAGTYAVGILQIDKSLSIIGANTPAKPVITPTEDTGLDNVIGSNGRGWFQITGAAVNLENFVFDGNGQNIRTAVHYHGDSLGGEVKSCDFVNISHISQYYGRGINNYGQYVEVLDCTFNNIQRIGVFTFNPTASTLMDGCIYTGKGPGDWLDYAFEAGGGGSIEINNCMVTDCNGIAEVDGSISAGILVTTFFGDGTNCTITDSNLTENTYGIAVGYDEDDTSVVVARCSKINGNFEGGVDNIVGAENSVDARYNWWGDASGPSGQGGGTGDAVSENVEFFPWLLSAEDCDDYTQLAADYVVDDDWAGLPEFTQVFVGEQDYYIGLNAFDNIQGAVDAASDGNSISVAEGEYFGAVIDEDLMITGANPGGSVITDGPHYGGGAAGLKTAFKLDSGASGTEITNFTIDCNSDDNFYFAIFSRAADDVVVDSLTVNNPVQGITNYGGSGWQITNNLINYTEASGGGGIAIYLGAYPQDYVVLQNNLVKGNSIISQATAPTYTCPGIAMCLDLRYGRFDLLTGNEDISYNMIVQNDIVGTGLDSEVGIEIGVIGLEADPNKIAATLGLIHDNIVRNNIIENTDWGIYFYTATDLAILGNKIVDCNDGIHIEDSHKGVVINFNSIYENSSYGINNSGSEVVDATYNWWGNISGPSDPCGVNEADGVNCYDVETVKNADDLGNAVSDGNVIYCPWLLAPVVTSDGPCPLGDLDGDCDVDFADLAKLADNWLVGTEE